MPTSSSRPAGAPQVLPYLYSPDAARALTFLIDAFGFTEIEAVRDAGGRVWTAQLSTGDGAVLIGPGMAEFGTRPSPIRRGQPPASSSMSTMSTHIANGHAPAPPAITCLVRNA